MENHFSSGKKNAIIHDRQRNCTNKTARPVVCGNKAREDMRKKHEKQVLRYMKKKLIVIFLVIAGSLMGLTIRMVYIVRAEGSGYEKKILTQQSGGSERIPCRRGEILAADGTVLAFSQDTYRLILDCRQLSQKENCLGPTAEALAACFPQVTEEAVKNAVKERPDSQYYTLQKGLTKEQTEAFEDLRAEVYEEGPKKGRKVRPDVTGVWFEKEYVRFYPFGSLACKVLGFTASGDVGIGGLEDSYNETLNGQDGRRFRFLNGDGVFEETVQEARNGYSLVTTLDFFMQKTVERKISEFSELHRDEFREGPGSEHTGVLILNVKNGQVLAMADSTGYDLNNPRDLSAYNTKEALEAMNEEELLREQNRIWQNFCISYAFEPGSTAKLLTVAAGLDGGALKDGDRYTCTGTKVVARYPIGCANGAVHGEVTLEEAIMASCNCALADMALEIGKTEFVKYQSIFHLGAKTGIDLPGEGKTDTLVYTKERMDDITLATNSFGQNFSVTMIQMAAAYASLVNGGYYYQPSLVRKILDENGATVKEISPTLLTQTVSGKTSETIRRYLYRTVEEGTGSYAKVSGYTVGGKTGTAQTLPRDSGDYVISFLGCTPAEDPQLLIYVVIEKPNLENQAQSRYASELAGEILEEILPYYLQ